MSGEDGGCTHGGSPSTGWGVTCEIGPEKVVRASKGGYIWRMPAIAIRFKVGADFRKDLQARVNAYLDKCGRPVRAPFAMYRKTFVLITWMA